MRLIDADALHESIDTKTYRHTYIEQIHEIIDKAPTIDAEPVKHGEWIPCDERLPDNKTYVLTTIQVSGRQPHVRSGFYHDGFFHNDNGDTWRAIEKPLKAWMPLPMPYREDGEK